MVNGEMINGYIKLIGRKERKVKNLSNSIRMSNTSTNCDDAEEIIRNSEFSVIEAMRNMEEKRRKEVVCDKQVVNPEKVERKEKTELKKRSLRTL